MSALDRVTDQLALYAANLNTQARGTLERMTAQDWIRLVIIVGAYALLRPYLLKLGGRHQAADHERALDPAERNGLKRAAGKVVRDPRDGTVRERLDVPEDTESEGEIGEARRNGSGGMDWGKKARRRQRRVVRTLLEKEERRREAEAERESDKEIEDLLVD